MTQAVNSFLLNFTYQIFRPNPLITDWKKAGWKLFKPIISILLALDEKGILQTDKLYVLLFENRIPSHDRYPRTSGDSGRSPETKCSEPAP